MAPGKLSEAELRSYVAYAATAGEDYQLFYGDPIRHAQEKARRARAVLESIGVKEPALRPLVQWDAEKVSKPGNCPDAELSLVAGENPTYYICLSTTSLNSLSAFALELQERNMKVDLTVQQHFGETAVEAWPRVSAALRWLALSRMELQLLINEGQ